MCKPGSACCGCAAGSGGLGVALAVLGALGAITAAATLISDILTAMLISAVSIGAGGAVLLVVILRRTRGAVTWPARHGPAIHAAKLISPARLTASIKPAAPIKPALPAPPARLAIPARPAWRPAGSSGAEAELELSPAIRQREAVFDLF